MLSPVVGMETAPGAPVDPAHDMSVSSQEAELCGSSRIAAVTGPALAQGMGTEWGAGVCVQEGQGSLLKKELGQGPCAGNGLRIREASGAGT